MPVLPEGTQPVTQWQVRYIGPLPLWRGQQFSLTRIDSYSRYAIVLLVFNTSVRTTMFELMECLVHHNDIPTT